MVKEYWFADHRDLIKWSVLVHLAHRHALTTIVWVPYLRIEKQRPAFHFNNEEVRVSDNVWTFFRGIRRIKYLANSEGLSIKLVSKEFNHRDRSGYSLNLQRHLNGYTRPLLLFLDPDTGLAPSAAKKEHVTDEEVRRAWADLRHGDWLVLYQHRWRNVNWINSASERMRGICGGAKIEVARSEKIARDVAFLCVQKPAKLAYL